MSTLKREADPIRFTVIVPTRERADTLGYCLQTLTTQNYDHLRILVSDNCSTDATADVVRAAADSRITYIRPDRRLSMAQHWEFALSHVLDGWVMFIGDDDGLCPGALRSLDEAIRESSVEAVNSAFSLFVWPAHLAEHPSGKLVVPLGTDVEVRSSLTELQRAFRGAIPYTTLPWLYNGGAASIRAINAARNREGKFFLSQTPDLYSAVALCLSLPEYLAVSFPIAVGGTSRHSTGYSTSLTAEKEEKGAAQLYASEDNIPFHKDLIFNASLGMLLYECYLQAEHLHTKAFSVDMEEQLQRMVDGATARNLPHVLEDCRKIATAKGLKIPSPRARILRRLGSLRGDLYRVANRQMVDPEYLGIRDVYAASVATKCIHWVAASHPLYRRQRMSASLIRRLLSQIVGLLGRKQRDVLGDSSS